MTSKEIKIELVGKKVSLMVTGLRVKGIITGIYKERTYEGAEILGLEIDHEPVQWGKDIYTSTVSMGSNLTTVQFI